MIALTIIDTDILIDAGRGVEEAVDLLTKIQSDDALAISVVTQLELMIGCRNKSELRNLDKFIKQFQIIKLNEAISEKAVELLRLFSFESRPSHRRWPNRGNGAKAEFAFYLKKPKRL